MEIFFILYIAVIDFSNNIIAIQMQI